MTESFLKNVDLDLEHAIAELMGIDLRKFHEFHAPLDLYDGLEQMYATEAYDYEDLLLEGFDDETANRMSSRVPKSYYQLEVAEDLYARLSGEITKYRNGISTPIVIAYDPGPPGNYDNVRLSKQTLLDWASEMGFPIPFEKIAPHRDSEDSNVTSDTQKIPERDGAEINVSAIDASNVLNIIAWFLDIFLEIQVPNWREAMLNLDNEDRPHWFIKKKLNVTSIVAAVRGSIPAATTPSSTTVRKYIDLAVEVIESEKPSEESISTREASITYRCLFSLAQQVASFNLEEGDPPGRPYSPRFTMNAAQRSPLSLPSTLTSKDLLFHLKKAHEETL